MKIAQNKNYPHEGAPLEIINGWFNLYKKTLNEIMASNTGQSIKKIEKDTDRDYIMTPQEALEYGMIDKVITKE